MPDSNDEQSSARAQLSDEDEDPEELEQVDQEQGDEVDMDISNSPIVHHRDERRENIKYGGFGAQWGPGPSTWGKYDARPQSDIPDMEERTSNFKSAGTSNEALRLKSQENFAGGGDCRGQELARNDARILSGKKASSHYKEDHVKNVINSDDKMKQVNDGKQMELRFSRLAASEKGTHIMSPAAETDDSNKRPALVCDFYAKGWCIRGTSCRFIHTKEGPNNSHPPEGDAAAASCSKEVKVDEGLRVIPERSRLPGFHDPLASSSGYSFPLPSHVGVLGRHHFQSVQHEEPNMGDSADLQKLQLHKDDLVYLTSFKDVGKDGQVRNWPADNYNSSPNKKGRYSTGNTSSHSSSMEDVAGVWKQRVHGDHTSPLVSHSLNAGSNTLIATGLFQGSRISNWTGFSLPASYSNLDAHPVGSRKLLDSNRDHHVYTRPSAFLKSSSPFASSELNTMSQHSAELKTKISSNNWEPSVPFRPSCILPSAFLSFSAQPYDPLRGSLELPKLANNSFEASFYSEGATAGKKLHQNVLPETASGTRPPACDADTKSMSSHNTYQEKVLDNSCYTRDPNSPVTEAETVGTSVVYQNGTLTKDENPMGHSQVKGSTNPNKISIFGDSKHQSDGSSSHQRDIKVDRLKENNEAKGEHITDGDVQQESKEIRQFRGALIELVKELLKPKWREGSLSKDAHNKIVKKAVDKILSAFQPQQIPPTIEAVTQYLSACHPKISKLVEGYIERYGKS